jgi:hypothetical protein
MHDWLRSRRFLVAAVAPWVLLYLILPQMHQRYLMWAAGISSLLAGMGASGVLLHLLITALAWGMMAHTMLEDWWIHLPYSRSREKPFFLDFFERTHPDLAWMLGLLAAILLYLAITTGRRRPALLASPGLGLD